MLNFDKQSQKSGFSNLSNSANMVNFFADRGAKPRGRQASIVSKIKGLQKLETKVA
jgi:hypothetical protein